MPRLSVVAIVAAYNEVDVIPFCLEQLIGNGIDVYVIDNHSTDGTADLAAEYLGRGVLNVERFPAESSGNRGVFSYAAILRRKLTISQELEADWFINHDADEFREGPWPDLDLRSSIELVDRLGWNAIDFELLNFWPVDRDVRPGEDPRAVVRRYTRAEPYDLVQIRCWKRTEVDVDLESSGGHEVAFPGRLVFPIRFLLRHYPFRGRDHAHRKVFHERLPRFDPDERARGWHIQYDAKIKSGRLLPEPAGLIEYDAAVVRALLAIENREVQRLDQMVQEAHLAVLAQATALEQLRDALLNAERETLALRAADPQAQKQRIAIEDRLALANERQAELNTQLASARDAASAFEEALGREITARLGIEKAREAADAALAQARDELRAAHRAGAHLQNEIAALMNSRTWRWSAAARRIYSILSRRP